MKKRRIRIAAALLAAAAIIAGVLLFGRGTERPTLAPGDEGPAVANAQLRLRELQCYSGAANGEYDAATEQAVRLFERLNGLSEDGCLTDKEQRLLYGTEARGSSFTVLCCDVGQGDCTLLECDGEWLLIDAGSSARRSYSILKAHGVDRLRAVICTHPHDDHAGGLAGALSYATTEHAYSCLGEADGKASADFIKVLDGQGVTLRVPAPGEHFELGSASVTFLGPIEMVDDLNNDSLIVRVDYRETSFLFMGDAEASEEQSLLEAGADLDTDVLRVGHHGSSTSTSQAFLDAVMPGYAVISVGADNRYGHPDGGTLEKLAAVGATVLRTDLLGDIVLVSDGSRVYPQGEAASVQKATVGIVADEAANGAYTFALNIGTKRFHRLDCSSVAHTKQENLAYTTLDADTLLAQGYAPCGSCSPTQTSTGEASPTEAPVEADFIINTRSGRFHLPGCEGARKTKEENREYYTGDRQALIDRGLKACGSCRP